MVNLPDEKEYVIQIINLKHALNYGLVLEKVHRIIKSRRFNQEDYTDWMQNCKNDFENDFLKLRIMQFKESLWKM